MPLLLTTKQFFLDLSGLKSSTCIFFFYLLSLLAIDSNYGIITLFFPKISAFWHHRILIPRSLFSIVSNFKVIGCFREKQFFFSDSAKAKQIFYGVAETMDALSLEMYMFTMEVAWHNKESRDMILII